MCEAKHKWRQMCRGHGVEVMHANRHGQEEGGKGRRGGVKEKRRRRTEGSSRACLLTPTAAALRPAAAGGQPEEGFHGAGRQCGAAGSSPTSALLGDQASCASRYARQADCATGRSRQRPRSRPAVTGWVVEHGHTEVSGAGVAG